jgi:hypothetical protein
MQRLRILRPLALSGTLLLTTALAMLLFISPAAANLHSNTNRQERINTQQGHNQPFQTHTLQQRIQNHELASTVQVLDSQAPSVIVQFPLFPSGVKAKFPNATGVVTIIQGNPEVSLFDTVTVDVDKMPPDTTFTIFLIEKANKPFGHVEYVADLHTREDGSGDVTFQCITLVAFAADAANPGVTKDQSGDASGIQLEHLGMWFSSLDDAKKQLGNNTLTGTPFDGGNPPLHAGPQAMTDGQDAPVF